MGTWGGEERAWEVRSGDVGRGAGSGKWGCEARGRGIMDGDVGMWNDRV